MSPDPVAEPGDTGPAAPPDGTDQDGDATLRDFQGLSHVLVAALEHTRSAVCITTSELDPPGPTIVYVNPAYLAMTGRTREEVMGATPRIMQGPLTDRGVLDRLRNVLEAGERFDGSTINYRADGAPFVIDWSIDPVRDGSGTITHFVAAQEDVTDQVRAMNLLEAEQELDRALTGLIDADVEPESALRSMVDRVVSAARTVAVVGSVDVSVVDHDCRVETRSGTSEDQGSDMTFELGAPAARLSGRIRVSGLGPDERAFLDTEGLTRLATRAAHVLGGLLEYQRQRHNALRLQRELLPDVSAPAGFEVVAHYAPAVSSLSVGGDWFDVATTPERVVFSVGDVSGKGVDAAALMGRLRIVAEVELGQGAPVPHVMGILDRLCREAHEMATLLTLEVDRATRSATLRSAGHVPPLVIRGGACEIIDALPAPPLGYMRHGLLREVPVELAAGDRVVLFTDGLVERRGDDLESGLRRLAAGVDTGLRLAALVEALVARYGPNAEDDLAILGVELATA